MLQLTVTMTDSIANVMYWLVDIDHKNKTVSHGAPVGKLETETETVTIGTLHLDGHEWREIDADGTLNSYILENTAPKEGDLSQRVAKALLESYLISIDGGADWMRIICCESENMGVNIDGYCLEAESDDLSTGGFTFDEILEAAKEGNLQLKKITPLNF